MGGAGRVGVRQIMYTLRRVDDADYRRLLLPVRSPILLEVIKLYCRSAFCSARDDVDDVLSSIKHRAAFKPG